MPSVHSSLSRSAVDLAFALALEPGTVFAAKVGSWVRGIAALVCAALKVAMFESGRHCAVGAKRMMCMGDVFGGLLLASACLWTGAASSAPNVREVPVLNSPVGEPASATPAGTSSDWWGQVQQSLAAREYRVSKNAIGLQAPNRAQQFRTYFDASGIRLVERSAADLSAVIDKVDAHTDVVAPNKTAASSTPSQPAEILQLGLSSWGRGDHLQAIAQGALSHNAQRVEIAHADAGITEWYENRADGLEQGFVMRNRPQGAGALRLEMRLSGAKAAQPSANRRTDEIELISDNGRRLRYAKLAAWDANQKPLDARMEARGSNLALIVNDRNAEYPITIDPLLSAVFDTQLESNQASAFLGFSVAGAGDVNGDGYADVIVGAYLFDNGATNEGAAFVYHGGANGVSSSIAAQLESNQSGANFGYSVAGAGDVNGDGYADVIAGAWLYVTSEAGAGAAFVYHGGPAGVNTASATQLLSSQAGASLGVSVAGAGDVNGDGFGDVIVGAFGFDNGQSNEGAAFVYHGSASGVSNTFAVQLESNQASAEFGRSVAGAGDVNGDGFADVIVGARFFDNIETNEGAAFVYHGASAGVTNVAAVQLEANQANASFGVSVAGAGDVNGDGYADVIVGAQFFSNGELEEGSAFIFHGSSSGADSAFWSRLESDQANASFGTSVAGAGDINADGYADVIVGASLFDDVQPSEGAAFVYYGGLHGVSGAADMQLQSNQVNAQFGRSVATAGDVNGDGFADVIVGAYVFDNGQADEGAAFVYHGGASGLSPFNATQIETHQAEAYLGWSVAGAGDVNADGFADVVVGAQSYDNGQSDEGAAFLFHGFAFGIRRVIATQLEFNQEGAVFGRSVAGAGDVNGDGYADVIVGAPQASNGSSQEGVALIYHGGVGGVNTVAAIQLESNFAFARFGESVSAAGDVNGDGYADVIVGAPRYSNGASGEGAAFIYHGGASGVRGTFVTRIESNQANAALGVSVAGAGDVNGDGYADVIVGAPKFANGHSEEGAAFIHHGGSNGVSAAIAAQLESNQASAQQGISVSGAGDVNGDGYSDVIVGAQSFSNDQSSEGAAFVYHGGVSGVSTEFPTLLESNQAGAKFGFSVAGAGDINGDGFADVVIGAPEFDASGRDGAVFVHHGSASGLRIVAGSQWVGAQGGAQLGYSVAAAGDVNGDGFADVVAGAPTYTNGQTSEGAAFVYLGNSYGRVVQARQLRSGGITPVAHWGFSHNNQANAFALTMRVTSPRGRERVKLGAEICPSGSDFGMPACMTLASPSWQDVTASAAGITLTLAVPALTTGALYHWRVRSLHAPYTVTALGVTAPLNPTHSPWRRLMALEDVADVRVTVPPGVSVTPVSGLVTSEVGGSATFTVVLNAQPGENVSIGLASSDATEGTVAPAALVFTSSNWNVAQTATVTGVDDAIDDGNISYNIATSAASAGADYNGIIVADVSVTNTDNDSAGVAVTPTSGLITTEAGGGATFTVVLNAQPSENVSIGLASSDATEGTVAPAALVFTSSNWNVAQTATVTGVDDAVVDGNTSFSIVTSSTSADGDYNAITVADVGVSNTDNDSAGVTVTPTSGLITTEVGGTATFSIVLTSQPSAGVSIDLSSSDISEGTVAFPSLSFTTVNWNLPQTVTVQGVDDASDDGDITYQIITTATSVDALYNGILVADVSVTNRDNELVGPGMLRILGDCGLRLGEQSGVHSIRVERFGGAAGSATLNYQFEDINALSAVDYSASNGVLTWASGELGVKSLPFTILADLVAEPREEFLFRATASGPLTLQGQSNVLIGILDGVLFGHGFDELPCLAP